MKILEKIKRWNWSLLGVTIVVGIIGGLGNDSIQGVLNAIIFGAVLGTILGLPMAIITREDEK